MFKVAVLTISDTRHKDNDESGKVMMDILQAHRFQVSHYDIVKDNKDDIKNKLIYYTDECQVDVIFTNGGTGIGPRDVTPEATREILDKQLPGISECIRIEGMKETKKAILSRGISGTRKNTLIINVPGSPKGAKHSLELILDIIPHAIEMVQGKGH